MLHTPLPRSAYKWNLQAVSRVWCYGASFYVKDLGLRSTWNISDICAGYNPLIEIYQNYIHPIFVYCIINLAALILFVPKGKLYFSRAQIGSFWYNRNVSKRNQSTVAHYQNKYKLVQFSFNWRCYTFIYNLIFLHLVIKIDIPWNVRRFAVFHVRLMHGVECILLAFAFWIRLVLVYNYIFEINLEYCYTHTHIHCILIDL
jgi:hypothetical protein